MSRLSFRRPVGQDAEALGVTAAEGIAAYAAFAPEGWNPPHEPPSEEQLADPALWWLVAESGGEPAGHVVLMPASAHAKPDPDPKLGHLAGLFVRPAFHGSGVATELMRRARVEASARGFTEGRLYCAAGYARARRFYEREGWQVAGDPFPEPSYGGLELVEYRLACR